MSKQQTIKNTVHLTGKGLHSGQPVHVNLCPAKSNTGIVFHRIDQDLPDIQVTVDKVHESPLCTTLIEGDNHIATIEHLMSALAGLSIDNIRIELDAPELPIMDGSAEPFVFILQSAGIKAQRADRHVMTVTETIRIEAGDRFVELSPYDGLRFELTIDFDHPVIQQTPQSIQCNFSEALFIKSISRARTFGFAKDIEMLHQQQRALGAGLDNAIGIDDNGIMNPEGLRYADEFVRHKLLDAIGDLYIAGPIQGLYRAQKPSHALNNQLVRKLIASSNK